MKSLNCEIQDLGLIDYKEAYAFQQQSVEDVIKGGPERLIICEHPPVLTLGRLASEENIFLTKTQLLDRSVEIHSIDRGGDVTLHAPGQMVVYPILNLRNYKKDLKYYFYKLEQVAIDFLKDFDILTCRIFSRTGIWVGQKKIMSIGIGVKKWISFHGFAVNVNTDLSLFSMIRPCGLNVQMTSIREIKGQEIDFNLAKINLIKHFENNFTESRKLIG